MSNFYGPELNDLNHIFVFGSNLRGRHGKGAALEAAEHWGAREGVGVGRSGQSYAIPTKDASRPLRSLPLAIIEQHVREFLVYARSHQQLTFLVTPIGCGLAGFNARQIAPFFRHAPANCTLPLSFIDVLLL